MPSAKIAERQKVYTPIEPVDKRGDEVDEGEGRTTKEEVTDSLRCYAADFIVCHVFEDDIFLHVVRCHSYKPADGTIKTPDHIYKYFISHCYCQKRRSDVVQQRRGQAHMNRRGRVLKQPTWAEQQQFQTRSIS